jgi:biotin synthase
MLDLILSSGQKILNEGFITRTEALHLTQAKGADIFVLAGMASKIREKFTGNHIDLCSIINAKSGNCSQDCKFCTQSSFHTCNIDTYPLLDEEIIVNQAHQMEQAGAHRFDIVISAQGVSEQDCEFLQILDIIRRIRIETGLQLCASLGILTESAAYMLKEAGISRYNHNLETAEDYFPRIVTTHSYQDRVKTVGFVKKAGMEVCSGGIIGLGESWIHRIDLAYALNDLKVDVIPINILNPVRGIRLDSEKPLHPLEIIKTIAIFRYILPRSIIRFAGGREVNLRDLQSLGLVAGLNGMLIGNYLTTKGRGIREDLQMIEDLGFSHHKK